MVKSLSACLLFVSFLARHQASAQLSLLSASSRANGTKIIIDTIQPTNFAKHADFVFIDFGKAAFGTLALYYAASRNDTVQIRLGEMLNQQGQVHSSPPGSVRYQEVKLPVRPDQYFYQVPLKPDRRNTLPAAVNLPPEYPTIMPFRYAEIRGKDAGKLKRTDVVQLAFHAPFNDNASDFESSDSVLNQVWNISKYSIKATSFTGYYVDGDRERIPYEADAYLNQLSHYCVDNNYSIARNTIRYLMANPTWPTEWQLHMAMMVEEDYRYTGDLDLIKDYYEALKHKSLIALLDSNGLISTQSGKVTPAFMKNLGFRDSTAVLKDIVDWPPAQKNINSKIGSAEGEQDGFVFKPYNTVVNAFFYNNLLLLSKFAKRLGKQEESNAFSKLAQKSHSAINQHMLDANKGIYVDGIGTTHASLHANMFALAFGIVPNEHIPSVIAFIKSRGMACSVYGAQYLLEGLYAHQEADYALSLLASSSDRSWYNMIREGSTITMEAWGMKYKPNADWNHAWGAVPANIIPRMMWGITPKTPGARIVSINPQLSTLQYAKIKVPFKHGNIIAGFTSTDDQTKIYTFTLDGDIQAELKFDPKKIKQITFNGKRLNVKTDQPVVLSRGTYIVKF